MRSSDFRLAEGYWFATDLYLNDVKITTGTRANMKATKRLMLRGYSLSDIIKLHNDGADIIAMARFRKPAVKVLKRGDRWWVISPPSRPLPFQTYDRAINFAQRKARQ